ncbi:MAG: hypothetical protein AAGG80_07790 [Pseudomonadota bacterium]
MPYSFFQPKQLDTPESVMRFLLAHTAPSHVKEFNFGFETLLQMARAEIPGARQHLVGIYSSLYKNQEKPIIEALVTKILTPEHETLEYSIQRLQQTIAANGAAILANEDQAISTQRNGSNVPSASR